MYQKGEYYVCIIRVRLWEREMICEWELGQSVHGIYQNIVKVGTWMSLSKERVFWEHLQLHKSAKVGSNTLPWTDSGSKTFTNELIAFLKVLTDLQLSTNVWLFFVFIWFFFLWSNSANENPWVYLPHTTTPGLSMQEHIISQASSGKFSH